MRKEAQEVLGYERKRVIKPKCSLLVREHDPALSARREVGQVVKVVTVDRLLDERSLREVRVSLIPWLLSAGVLTRLVL